MPEISSGDIGVGALEAQLEVVEAGRDELREFGLVEREAGGDEVDVEAGGARGFYEFENVGRASGSPPVKSAWRAPSAAACWKTLDQISVESSVLRAVSSRGFEQ